MDSIFSCATKEPPPSNRLTTNLNSRPFVACSTKHDLCAVIASRFGEVGSIRGCLGSFIRVYLRSSAVKVLGLFPLFLAAAVLFPSMARSQQTEDDLIVPGKRIGEWRLGPNAENPEPTLALPDWLIYIRFKHLPGVRARLRPITIAVHKVSNRSVGVEPGDGFTVDLIYVDGGSFHTANGYTVYSDKELARFYPEATPLSENPKIYDDQKQGIAFEFGADAFAKSCVGIMVHLPGKPAFTTLEQVMAFRKKAGY
jgi:hypothetical protein